MSNVYSHSTEQSEHIIRHSIFRSIDKNQMNISFIVDKLRRLQSEKSRKKNAGCNKNTLKLKKRYSINKSKLSLPIKFNDNQKRKLKILYWKNKNMNKSYAELPKSTEYAPSEKSTLDLMIFHSDKNEKKGKIDSLEIEEMNECFSRLKSTDDISTSIEKCERKLGISDSFTNANNETSKEHDQSNAQLSNKIFHTLSASQKSNNEKCTLTNDKHLADRLRTNSESSCQLRVTKTNGNQREDSSHLNKRKRKYPRKQVLYCAHCDAVIGDVAFINGTQQLCGDCADLHFDRVTKSRLQERPIGYKEFKILSGDTIYSAK